MTNEEAWVDLANSILRMRRSFVRLGLQPPKAIELASHKDGDRLRCCTPGDLVRFDPGMGRHDDPEWVATICGTEVRYPGHWRARERGGRDLV